MSFRDLPCVTLKVDGGMTPLRVYEAQRFLARALGLLGAEGLHDNEALWIRPCGSVHTIGMRFPIDVLFLDRQQRVLGIRRQLKPLRFAACRGAYSTIELAAGTVDSLPIAVGVRVES
jgi:uncharacterized membrane protein (UPF0127 family)